MSGSRDPTSYRSGRNAGINPVGPGGAVNGGRSIGDQIARKYSVDPTPQIRAEPAPKPTKPMRTRAGRTGQASVLRQQRGEEAARRWVDQQMDDSRRRQDGLPRR